jgi:hypothetical protein
MQILCVKEFRNKSVLICFRFQNQVGCMLPRAISKSSFSTDFETESGESHRGGFNLSTVAPPEECQPEGLRMSLLEESHTFPEESRTFSNSNFKLHIRDLELRD